MKKFHEITLFHVTLNDQSYISEAKNNTLMFEKHYAHETT